MIKLYAKFTLSVIEKSLEVSKKNTILLILVFAVSSAISTLVPVYLGQGVGYALGRGKISTFIYVAILFCLMWFFSSAIKYIAYPLYGTLEQKAQSYVATNALMDSYDAPKDTRAYQDDSEVSFAIDAQMSVFRDVFSILIMSLLPALIVLITGFVSLTLIGGWHISFIYLLGMLLFIFFSLPLVNRHQEAQGVFFSASMENFGILSNSVGYWKEVSIFKLNLYQTKKYLDSRRTVEVTGIQSYRVTRMLYLLQSFFLVILLIFILIIYLKTNEGSDINLLAAGFMSLTGVCMYSIQTIQDIGFGISQIATSYSQDKESNEKINGNHKTVSANTHVECDFSPMSGVKSGIVWLIGDSGVGKTTSVESLLGFNSFVQDGGQVDLSDYNEVRYLPQESNLTFETAADLIRAGRPYIDPEEINEMFEALGIAEFAEGGVREKTILLGENGKVSGGEARRIALARTLIGVNGSLLILDEPTTGIGSVHRYSIWQTIRRVAQNNLVLIISHDSDAPIEANDILIKIKSR